ncbi:MAG TPA: sigma-70 family RNA polymerase sigma factor [Ktedonobacteraceae bacterium]|nr:sigma-70 family RNA polymerase sigma factor [Ktedonobacteraceae bacterium]
MDAGRAAISSLWVLPTNTTKSVEVEEARAPRAASTAEEQQTLSFDEMYQRYYPRVLAFLRFRMGQTDVAEDLTSLVFERALLHIADLQTGEAAGAWLFRIARNCAADYFRRRRQDVSLDMLIDSDYPDYCSHTLPLASSPEEVALLGEERASLLRHLSRLSEREREVIGLKFVACLHNCEIARVMHIPPGTVGSILHRALGRLRDALYAERERR